MHATPRAPLTLFTLALAAACAPDEGDVALEVAGEDSLVAIDARQVGRTARGYKLNEKGFVDTDLRFTEFFGAAFTVSAWFMPEFTSCYYGPILGESGGGYFVVGLGDYRQGDGGYLEGGSPVLYMKVGDKHASYLAPGLVKRGWNHLAVVRTATLRGGGHAFHLYLNGQRLRATSNAGGTISAAPEITFSDADPVNSAPRGVLRFGRRTSDEAVESSRTWQYFGLLDEVAVYRGARTPSEIAQLAGRQRVLGTEPDLLAGWTFDDFEPLSWLGLSPALKRPYVATGPAYRILLSWPRSESDDARQFDNPFFVGPTEARYRLPFPVNQVWRVVQGYDAPAGSHNGYAAFSMDFARVDASTAYARVTASATGHIVNVNESVDPDPDNPREPYTVSIRAAPREFAGYLHLAHGSWTDVFLGGEPMFFPPSADDPATAMAVTQGEALAELGPVAAHLHYGVSSHLGVRGMFPAAFEAYHASDDQGATWTYVFRGIPRAGQWIHRDQ